MRGRRAAVVAALALSLTSLSPLAAHADSTGGNTYYVQNNESICDDSGAGTEAQPFCSISAAAAVATSPGDTVLIEPGGYTGEIQITASGTAADPITFKAATPAANSIYLNVNVTATASSDDYGLYLNGASYVDVSGIRFYGSSASGHSVELENSSHDTVNQVDTFQNIVLAGNSGDDTISRASLYSTGNYTGSAISVDSSGTGNVITTNDMMLPGNVAGVTVLGSADAAVTSNTIWNYCGAGIAIGDDANGTASGASIQNNVIEEALTNANAEGTCAAGDSAGISIASAADESGLTANYNDVFPDDSVSTEPYEWAGTSYQTAAALDTATGQGAADSNANPEVSGIGEVKNETSPVINAANSDAPGELSTDIWGVARQFDPNVPETGAGIKGYDRGSNQFAESLEVVTANIAPKTAPSGAAVSMTSPVPTDTWANATYTYTFDFGDGSADVTTSAATVPHTYASTGSYTGSVLITSSYGATTTVGFLIKILTPVTFAASLAVTPSAGLGIDFVPTVTTDWPITTEKVSFGDGTTLSLLDDENANDGGEGGVNPYHLYAKPGTYTVTFTVADAGGEQKVLTQSFTTAGSEYFPYGPTRLLDTRKGLGGTSSQLTNDGSIKLKIAGTGSIPANVTAVDLNLTVVAATGNGYIQVNKGSGSTGTSNLNYRASSIYSNSVVAPVAADGTITLQNFGINKSVTPQLIADISGYYASSVGSTYTVLGNSARIMDTRSGVGGSSGKLAAGKTDVLTIAGADGGALPSSGITAVALNVTATDTSDAGYLTVYGDGSALPGTSNLNWQGATTKPASVVAPVGSDGKIDITNGSNDGGAADVIVDISGYFAETSTGAVYVPVAPTRALDTRKSSALGANSAYWLDLEGVAGMPSHGDSEAKLTGYVVNATVTDTEGSGWLAAGSGSKVPATTSNLNWSGVDQTTTNLSFASEASPVASADYEALFYNGGGSLSKPVDLIVDVMGYFSTK